MRLFKYIFGIAAFILVSSSAFSQKLSSSQSADIDKYRQLFEAASSSGNKAEMLEYKMKTAKIYYDAEIFNSAATEYEEALRYTKDQGTNVQKVAILNILGLIYFDKRNFAISLDYYKQASDVAKICGDKKSYVNALLRCAVCCDGLSDLRKAITYCESAASVAKDISDIKSLKECYKKLGDIYGKLGNPIKQKEYNDLCLYVDKAKSAEEIRNIQNKADNEIDKAYAKNKETQTQLESTQTNLSQTKESLTKAEEINRQKQMENDLLRKDQELTDLKLKESELQIQAARNFKTMVSIIFALIAVIVVVLLKFLHDRKKANVILKQTNDYINQQNVLLNDKNKEIENQRNELAWKNNQIIDSINYASRIQKAILPSLRSIAAGFPESFIFFLPRDIVSGDFYWYSQHGDYSFMAAVDCTGHSVPGAFVSMIGNTLLNEIVNEKQIYDPAEILRKMNLGTINTFRNENLSIAEQSEDGMDMTLCRFDFKNRKLTIAMSNHTVFTFLNGQCTEIDGDYFSIGGGFEDSINSTFTNHTIDMEKGLTVYMFSDGYGDQFGGPDGRKFMQENLKKLLSDIQDSSMFEQYDILSSTLEKWKGNYKQVDDILVLGIRITV